MSLESTFRHNVLAPTRRGRLTAAAAVFDLLFLILMALAAAGPLLIPGIFWTRYNGAQMGPWEGNPRIAPMQARPADETRRFNISTGIFGSCRTEVGRMRATFGPAAINNRPGPGVAQPLGSVSIAPVEGGMAASRSPNHPRMYPPAGQRADDDDRRPKGMPMHGGPVPNINRTTEVQVAVNAKIEWSRGGASCFYYGTGEDPFVAKTYPLSLLAVLAAFQVISGTLAFATLACLFVARDPVVGLVLGAAALATYLPVFAVAAWMGDDMAAHLWSYESRSSGPGLALGSAAFALLTISSCLLRPLALLSSPRAPGASEEAPPVPEKPDAKEYLPLGEQGGLPPYEARKEEEAKEAEEEELVPAKSGAVPAEAAPEAEAGAGAADHGEEEEEEEGSGVDLQRVQGFD
ncbi:hypothetical protein DFJ74DRAFT_655868 [Hyaloraphidium curvatum]|nr:hypothetical protein DFJ74DRAFT_655868 [Hyaloraphidium curvatum]